MPNAGAALPTRPAVCLTTRVWGGVISLALLLASPVWAQVKPVTDSETPHQMVAVNPNAPQQTEWLQELDKKYPGLVTEFANLQARLAKEVQLPGPRLQSRLLPLLPDSTVFYAAIPNYGDSLHQAVQIFDQELKDSAVLHDWFQHSDFASDWPKMEQALNKGYEFSQYLGDEIVISGFMNNKEPAFLVLAEVRKPGLKAFIPQLEKLADDKTPSSLRVLEPQELAAAKDNATGAVVLVRTDLVVAGSDLATVRKFNSQLQSGGGKFAGTELGDRLSQGYRNGTVLAGGIDLQRLLRQVPMKPAERSMFESLGVANVKYAIWQHNEAAGQGTSQAELTFAGPRRGIASWLAPSAPLQSLEMISPKAAIVASLRLKNPADIFEDIKEIANTANPGSMAMISQLEQGLGINLKEDLLSKLTGELTIETQAPEGQEPAWKVLLGVSDADALQQTLNRLFSRAGIPVQHYDEGGLRFYSLSVPNGPKPMIVHFAFSRGYLLVGPSRSVITDALQLRADGTSLARSREFIDSLPNGHSAISSAVIYQNFGLMMASSMKQLSPDASRLLAGFRNVSQPVTMCLYGEDSAIKEISTGGYMDVATVALITAAIAVPNLLRSRMAANEAAAVSMLRTVNTAQVTYATTYPGRRYAPALASLGPGTGNCKANEVSPKHACLIDASVGGASCTAGAWCTRGGYRFTVVGTCRGLTCSDYVAVATPANANTGTKNYCSVSDFIIRTKAGPPLKTPVTPAECRSWFPLK